MKSLDHDTALILAYSCFAASSICIGNAVQNFCVSDLTFQLLLPLFQHLVNDLALF